MIEDSIIIREDIHLIASTDLPWEEMHNRTILISGGSGFLASYLVKALLLISQQNQLNIKIICVVRNIKNAKLRLANYMYHSGLLIIEHDISKSFPSDFHRADYIIHCASQASPKYYGVDPIGTLLANSIGTKQLLDYALKSRSEKFLFFSSGEVYGIPINTEQPIGEMDFGHLDPMNVRACYAESKRIGETMCVAWAHQHGLHTCVVRPFHTYGPDMLLNDGRVFADFVANVINNEDIVIKSDGMARRTFCYITDATIGFLTLLLKGEKAQAYNVANPETEVSMRELAIIISNLYPERKINTRFDITFESNHYLKSPISISRPSINKIKSLGWFPKINLHDGFRRTIQSYLISEKT
jgi:UDP-glucuronate decarboxylase